MKIVQLTPGAGAMFCGNCLRDNSLTGALRACGADVLLVPLYLPLHTDEPDQSGGTPVFFGGINVYLQQKNVLFRKLPNWLDRWIDARALLNLAAKSATKVRPEDLGELTLSMLRGEEGLQVKELERLTEWLKGQPKPDVIVLSNILLAGMARRLKQELKVPVISTLQGEDYFLDGMPEPFRTQAWAETKARAAELDGFIAVSRYYGAEMARRLELRPGLVHVVHNGIDVSGYTHEPAVPERPTLGYFARMCPEKGLATLIDAFLLLRARPEFQTLRLRIGGSCTGTDEDFVAALRAKLAGAKAREAVDWHPNLDRAQKLAFFHGLTAFTVPAAYGEAFGLYLLEAQAAGVPVVQPQHAAFPELLERLGGGRLYAGTDAAALAEALAALLSAPAEAQLLGAAGRRAVLEYFSMDAMARGALRAYERVLSGEPAPDWPVAAPKTQFAVRATP